MWQWVVDIICGWMHAGGEAVLSPTLLQSSSRAAPAEVLPEMAVDRQKSQEGSGVLCVKVITDGPTRVLQITDVTQQVRHTVIVILHWLQMWRHIIRWQTQTTRCITANMQVDAQCNKPATKLSWQCFTSKVVSLQLLHLHLTYPTCTWRLRWGWPSLSFAKIFASESLGYCGVLFAWSYV